MPRVLLFALFLSTLAGEGGAQPSLVILVRHAERDTMPANDPVLTPAGHTRATELAKALEGVRLGSIIVTQYRRTRLTAAPIAETRGLSPIIVGAGGSLAEHVRAVARAVRQRPAGEAVLVVGHTLTIPAIVAALGGPALPDLCESDYSTLLVLQLIPDGQHNLVRTKYGADTPPCLRLPNGNPMSGAGLALPVLELPSSR